MFQSTHSLRSATPSTHVSFTPSGFQSTHSLRSATFLSHPSARVSRGFNPRTPCGVRQQAGTWKSYRKEFQSTHSLRSATGIFTTLDGHVKSFNPRTPCGVRQAWRALARAIEEFQSPHSLRSATLADSKKERRNYVSIHALLAECDRTRCQFSSAHDGFNPRTPCGVRPDNAGRAEGWHPFQSTHSLRSATAFTHSWSLVEKVSIHALLAECDFLEGMNCKSSLRFQSTHSLRSATSQSRPPWRPVFVSIHALLAECDGQSSCPGNTRDRFQSTHSLRSATLSRPANGWFHIVSIHALLAECDGAKLYEWMGNTVSIHALLAECDNISTIIHERTTSFNPRTPCGVRPSDCEPVPGIDKFQSTHSLRSATLEELLPVHDHAVSIHALLAECDPRSGAVPAFSPVSIHALLAECDVTSYMCPHIRPVSIHALLAECDLPIVQQMAEPVVSIHALLAECDASMRRRK